MGMLLIWWPLLVCLLILNFLLFHANSFNTSLQLSCHEAERSALLQFKHSFVIDESTCQNEGDYPKTSSWEAEGGSSNCCLWDGVECDEETGHVIGLDLGGGCICGSFDSNSTLFHLVHLQKLNLGYNNFNRSSIPASIGLLTEMTHLNLSSSFFFGHVPYEISRLSKLSFLDLSMNFDADSRENFLKLERPVLRSLAQNLTRLEMLRLNRVDMLSKIPDFLSNFSSLKELGLAYAGLYGSIPSSLCKLTQLTVLDLNSNLLSGYIPSSLQNLTQLTILRLYRNYLSGPIPSWLGNLTKLNLISLFTNELDGSIPQSLSKLDNLEYLFVDENNLSGTIEFDMFLKMRRLVSLILGANKLSVNFGARNVNATTLPKFKVLGLSLCNIREFPDFLVHENELRWMDLADNSIQGHIPKWIWNGSVETLKWVNVSNNFVTGFENQPTVLPWLHLEVLDLHSNILRGPLPIPPSSTLHLDVSNNMLSGEISSLPCNLSSIRVLDLSNNNFSGTIPHCFENTSSSLLALNLRNNSFHGSFLPLSFGNESRLRMIDLSHNQFQGKLPRSLANCMMLEYIDFSNNQLTDVFPAWLGTLQVLEVLLLRKNGFYGEIERHQNTSGFSNLRIVDLSYNSFTGELPSDYIFVWNRIQGFKMRNLTYMNAREIVKFSQNETNFFYYFYSTTIMNKRVETFYGMIREELALIDLSSNKFSGKIPEFIENLMVVRSLNLSNNMLTGRIPLSIGSMSQLESLDLSQNMLSGEIPQQLTQLTFLQSFSVAHNDLTGPIPQGNQLRTFDRSSFEGNPGLCGDPLPKKCEESKDLPPSADKEDDDSGIKLDWKFVLAGVISGFVIGIALGDIVITERTRWFLRYFRRIPPRIEIRQRRN